jgi:hypothetical protein
MSESVSISLIKSVNSGTFNAFAINSKTFKEGLACPLSIWLINDVLIPA